MRAKTAKMLSLGYESITEGNISATSLASLGKKLYKEGSLQTANYFDPHTDFIGHFWFIYFNYLYRNINTILF